MKKKFPDGYRIDYVEIYTPMAKAMAYWHVHALGFRLVARADSDTGVNGTSSYVLTSGEVRLVLTSTYPMAGVQQNAEVASYISQHYCGVKRMALQVQSVKETFEKTVAAGAIPVKFPVVHEDDQGIVEEAAIRMYDNSEIVFINREKYRGSFKPGYKAHHSAADETPAFFTGIDHIAAEVRINESIFWTQYFTNTIGTSLVQSIQPGEDNSTGMVLYINQSPDKNLTLVVAEPQSWLSKSKVQKNIETFGPGIHHLAFATDDINATVREFSKRQVEFVNFPSSYYELLRGNTDFADIDIDMLEANGILIDKEGESYLLQKFIKPMSDRPFFIYEIVQRVNGYDGFALKNINVLKKAEEMTLIQA